MISDTAYLVIPKEKAEREIVSSETKLVVLSKSDDRIVIGKEGSYGSTYERAILTDYKYKNQKVETPDGSLESGVLGSKLEYDTKSSHKLGRKARKAVSEFIETG